jgi:hypothetical protein
MIQLMTNMILSFNFRFSDGIKYFDGNLFLGWDMDSFEDL